jgi:hypothetical protein
MSRDVRVWYCSSYETAREVYNRIHAYEPEGGYDGYDGYEDIHKDIHKCFDAPMYCSKAALHNVSIATGIFSYEEVFEAIGSIIGNWECEPSRLANDPDAKTLFVWAAILREMDSENYVIIQNN